MAEEPSSRAYWDKLLKLVSRHTRGRGDAEDLLHSAYIRLERYRSGHVVDNPSAFLLRTATNIAIDIHRHERLQQPCGDNQGVQRPDDAPLQDEVLAARARLARVKEGLAKLTPRTREIFLMHRLQEMKYREIAVHFGISQSAVEKHIAKAALFLTNWTQGW
jgi:RNA polymerase sigma-70 factor (ECF subfamily)